MKTLLVIPSTIKRSIAAEAAADRHPTLDYEALRAALAAEPDGHVDTLDYTALAGAGPLARAFAALAGEDAALALVAFQRRDRYDVIFSNAESVALPLALLLKSSARRPRHVTIGHRLSARKKQSFFRIFQAHAQMDAIFVYSAAQHAYAHTTLGIPKQLLRLIPFHADHRFFRPLPDVAVNERQLCAAGLEWRDYPTLISAVEERSELTVRLAAASPWSRHRNETEARRLPAHIEARSYDYEELRKLYACSALVVVPLYENDFQAGITTILEAMAAGKPVVVTRTIGQTDVIIDGVTGIYVSPGGVEEWRAVVARLLADPARRARLGQAARAWVEENATLDRWVENVVAAIYDRPVDAAVDAPRKQLTARHAAANADR